MRLPLKIISSVICWVGWYALFLIFADPKYLQEPLQTMPIVYNPFILLKWFFWDNSLMAFLGLALLVMASSMTYVYIKLFDSIWDSPSVKEERK